MSCHAGALGNPGAVKHAKSALVFARASGSFQLGINVLSDFKLGGTMVSSAAFNLVSGGPLWDSAVWDDAVWAADSGSVVNQAWMGISGSGHYLAPVSGGLRAPRPPSMPRPERWSAGICPIAGIATSSSAKATR